MKNSESVANTSDKTPIIIISIIFLFAIELLSLYLIYSELSSSSIGGAIIASVSAVITLAGIFGIFIRSISSKYFCIILYLSCIAFVNTGENQTHNYIHGIVSVLFFLPVIWLIIDENTNNYFGKLIPKRIDPVTNLNNQTAEPSQKRTIRRSRSVQHKFDIESWNPSKLTYRDWFISLVIIMGIPLIAYDLFQVYIAVRNQDFLLNPIMCGIIALEISAIISLIFLWFLHKWAAKLYIILSLILIAIISSYGGSIYRPIFHVLIVILALKSVWKPPFIPSHIKSKLGIT